MSILQEALRRKDAEQSDGGQTAPPPLPAGRKTSGRAPRPGGGGRTLLLLVLLALAGAWFWHSGRPKIPVPAGDAPGSGDGSDRALSTAGRIRDQVTAAVKKAGERVETFSEDTLARIPDATPAPPPAAEPPALSADSARPEPDRPVPEPDQGKPVEGVDRVPPPREGPVARSSTKWPVLTVSGILTLNGKANVLIGNEVMGVGEDIKGVRVIRIGDNEVTLLYGTEQKTLRTGQTTQPR